MTFYTLRMLCFISLSMLFSCSGGSHENAATRDLSAREKMYYEQYRVQGRTLYQQHCVNCHQEDGSGLGRLISPLKEADYLLEDFGRAACIIKYGMEGSILVNGIDYNQPMPANEQLTDIEVAQILTYITNSWQNQSGYFPVSKVSTYLDNCDDL